MATIVLNDNSALFSTEGHSKNWGQKLNADKFSSEIQNKYLAARQLKLENTVKATWELKFLDVFK